MLPESKSDFPKCVYLDQNMWIGLAQAHNGKPEGLKFQPCLESVRTAVASGKLVVPFGVWNAIESLIPGNEGRRKRLAEFMVGLSGNKTLPPEHVVAPLEIANATRQLFGMPATGSPRKALVQTGMIHAIGMDKDIQGLMPGPLGAGFAATMSRPEASIDYLAGLGSQRDQIEAARAGEAGARELFQADRTVMSIMSVIERQRAEMSGLFKKIPEYQAALSLRFARLWGWFRESSRDLFIQVRW